MRVTEIIRGILDLIDQIEDQQDSQQYYDDESRRMDQIDDLQGSSCASTYANEPDEQVAGIASVTVDAGGGWQEPKHPADIRGEHGRVYGDN